MPRRSHRYEQSRTLVDRSRSYTLTEALEQLKAMAPARFDETVEVSVQLGIDPRHSESGTSVQGQVRISKVGNRHLRAALFLPAMVASQHEPRVRAYQARPDGIIQLPCLMGVIKVIWSRPILLLFSTPNLSLHKLLLSTRRMD